jgi:hypothetical protein
MRYVYLLRIPISKVKSQGLSTEELESVNDSMFFRKSFQLDGLPWLTRCGFTSATLFDTKEGAVKYMNDSKFYLVIGGRKYVPEIVRLEVTINLGEVVVWSGELDDSEGFSSSGSQALESRGRRVEYISEMRR